ncbi:MAG: hypothetical protein A2W31_14625 [Planctomycetes bacterium RBG_16_64_10]|nr:MAG: hypothetical protein A2W31_14625 [Planctomycetes bacterium RBG_16_64_10]
MVDLGNGDRARGRTGRVAVCARCTVQLGAAWGPAHNGARRAPTTCDAESVGAASGWVAMLEFPTIPLAQALLMLGVGFGLLAALIYLARRFRDDDDDDRSPAHNMLTKFRDLHSKGELSDEEFRTIKTKLASQLQAELKDNDETG